MPDQPSSGSLGVHLYGKFRRLMPDPSVTSNAAMLVEVQPGDVIESILQRLGIDPGEVSHLFLNPEYSGPWRRVQSGDRLAIFPREMGLLYRQYFPKKE